MRVSALEDDEKEGKEEEEEEEEDEMVSHENGDEDWMAVDEEEEEEGGEEPPGPGGKRGRAASAPPPAPAKRRRGRAAAGLELPEEPQHPAEVPPANGVCYLLNMANADAQRIIFSHLDRVSITQLSFTCHRIHHVIHGSDILRQALIPLTSRPNHHCCYCRKFLRSKSTRSSTCVLGHEVFVHNECFKRMIRHTWQNDLSNSCCPIAACSSSLIEYGKPAHMYKGNGTTRRAGVLKSMFKSVGRPSNFGFGGFGMARMLALRLHLQLRAQMMDHNRDGAEGGGGGGPVDCVIA